MFKLEVSEFYILQTAILARNATREKLETYKALVISNEAQLVQDEKHLSDLAVQWRLALWPFVQSPSLADVQPTRAIRITEDNPA